MTRRNVANDEVANRDDEGNAEVFARMQGELQAELTRGWQVFLNGPHFQRLKEFAVFLDGIDEFQQVHRKRIPHPAHEYAARIIGIPLMSTLVSWGLATSFWFPGDYYTSTEADVDSPHGEVHARVFTMDLLFNNGKDRLCELTFAFPHLHDGFGFLHPQVSITKQYTNDASTLLALALEIAARPVEYREAV
jgi:hypothetical protein